MMPIHEKLRGRDFQTTRNYLRVSLCNIHDELIARMDRAALERALTRGCRGIGFRSPRTGEGGAMDRTSGGAPLLSLDAVVIDTETTGLDPRKARVIELAGRAPVGRKAGGDGSFRQLLRPGDESIPAETTRIHGIDDAMVAQSPLVRGCLAGFQQRFSVRPW